MRMIHTTISRLYPTSLQEKNLYEIFTIYNSVKRIGYKLLFDLKDSNYPKKEKRMLIQPKLIPICCNNPTFYK